MCARFSALVRQGACQSQPVADAEFYRELADAFVSPGESAELEDGQLDNWQCEALERYEAARQDDPFLAELAECENVAICENGMEDWQKEALESYAAAEHRRAVTAAARAVRREHQRTRLRARSRSCLGGRRRPGRRSTRRAASRSAGGGDPDEPGPGERAGYEHHVAESHRRAAGQRLAGGALARACALWASVREAHISPGSRSRSCIAVSGCATWPANASGRHARRDA
jgi:hypothetical protein